MTLVSARETEAMDAENRFSSVNNSDPSGMEIVNGESAHTHVGKSETDQSGTDEVVQNSTNDVSGVSGEEKETAKAEMMDDASDREQEEEQNLASVASLEAQDEYLGGVLPTVESGADETSEEESEPEVPQRRRSTRQRRSTAKAINYFDKSASEESGSGSGKEEEEEEERPLERFLARKPANKTLLNKVLASDERYNGSYLYLCKFKNTSYLHVEWIHEDEIRRTNWRLASRLQRYVKKAKAQEEEAAEELGWTTYYKDLASGKVELFDPQYLEVERILAEKKEVHEESERPKTTADLHFFSFLNGETADDSVVLLDFGEAEGGVKKVVKTLYLIKWTGLSYTEITWEFASDINDDLQLALFHRRNRPPVGLADGGKDTFESSEMTELNTALWPALGTQAASVSSILKIRTKARYPVRLEGLLVDLLMQGEISGVLPGDEIIAVGEVSVQGKKLNDATAHIRARAQESKEGRDQGYMLTIRRFVKRREHLPVETALFNVRFSGLASLGLMLKSPEADHSERPVARHAEAILSVFVEDVLTPRYYKPETKGDTTLFTSRWLRYAIVSYVVALVYHYGSECTLESLCESIGCSSELMHKWLSGWKSTNAIDEVCEDEPKLRAFERHLWDWVNHVAVVHRLGTYGLITPDKMCHLLLASSRIRVAGMCRVLFTSLEILKRADELKKEMAGKTKSETEGKKKNVEEDGPAQLDKAKMHILSKVEPLVQDMLQQVCANVGSEPYQALPAEESLFSGSSIVRPDDFHLKMSRYMKRVIVAVSWLRAGSPTMFTSWMPLPEENFIGVVDTSQQRDLQRQDLQYRAAEDKKVATRAPQKNDGYRYQQRYIGRLRRRTFVPYTQRTQPRYKHNNQLRSYQLQGVNWILSKWYSYMSCILADEMGLGKTVQVVATLEHMRTKEDMRGPFLIIAPLSTIGHWKREIEGWTDMNLCMYYDSGGSHGREQIRKYEWYYTGYENRVDMVKFNVMVTTYETFMADVEYMMELPWLSIVVDEGHRLRSVKSKLLDMLKRITGAFRLLLTGTPLQNNMLELWSLLNFCDREAFRSRDRFLEEYGDLQSKEQLDDLQNEIAPYILRRVKEDVEKSIPPKEETIVDVELTMMQKRYYRAIFDKNRSFLYQGCKAANKPQLINVEMELRKCCNHPYIVAGVQERELKKLRRELLERMHIIRSGNEFNMELEEDEESELTELELDLEGAVKEGKSDEEVLEMASLERSIRSSGKMVLVDKLLPKLKAEGHKVLIFSQMVTMLNLLENYCIGRGYGYERLDGSIQGNSRQAAIDRFSDSASDSFVFLLSTRAGGVGINLTAADTVIIFDSDWNPQNDAQAQARCHRIGQKKAVRIYRLVTTKTYEETMLQRAAMKLGLEQAVLGRGGKNGGIKGSNMSPAELEKMLRKGAYHHLDTGDDGQAAKSFCKADIEQLLKTNTRTVKVDTISGQMTFGNLTHNTVNKSSFNAEGEDGVDVDDPDFWKKVLPDETSPDMLLSKLNDSAHVALLTSSIKERRVYISSVRRLVRETLQLRQTGEIIGEHDMETTCSILIQIANMKKVFKNDTFQDTVFTRQQGKRKPFVVLVSKWLKLLEASKERRARRTMTKKGDDSSDDELYSADDEPPENNESEVPEQSYVELSEEEDEEPKKRRRRKSRGKSRGSEPSPKKKKRKRKSNYNEAPALPDEPTFDEKTAEEGYMVKDFTTEVCAICADGGSLVLCEGPCKRAFHLACLDIPDQLMDTDADWYCPDCEDGKQRCMICTQAGEQDEVVFKCQDSTCGRFFHPNCVKQSQFVKYPQGSKKPEVFVCPLHTCAKCGEQDKVSVQCIRCPNAYHSRCLDRTNTLRLHLNLIICQKHLNGKIFTPAAHAAFEPPRTKVAILPDGYRISRRKTIHVRAVYTDTS